MTEAEKDHQGWIMGRTETFLEPFFQVFNDGDLKDARLIEWAEVLAPLSARAINAAMIDYHRNGPRSVKGKLLKPAAGDIYAIGAKIEPPKGGGQKFDRAASFAERYKNGGVPSFLFKDDKLIAEVLDRKLLPMEGLKHHGAFIPARHDPDKIKERKDT